MKKKFVTFAVGAGPELSQREIDFANLIGNLIIDKRFRTVFIAYGSALDSIKVKAISDIMEQIAEKANFLGFNGFSCLNKRQANFGYMEVKSTIEDFNSDVNIIIVDTEARGTEHDPIPAFLDNFSKSKSEVLLDLNATMETVEEKVSVQSTVPVGGQASNNSSVLTVTLNLN